MKVSSNPRAPGPCNDFVAFCIPCVACMPFGPKGADAKAAGVFEPLERSSCGACFCRSCIPPQKVKQAKRSKSWLLCWSYSDAGLSHLAE